MNILNNIIKSGKTIIIIILIIIIAFQYFTKQKIKPIITQLPPTTTILTYTPEPIGIIIPSEKTITKIITKIKTTPTLLTHKDTINIIKNYIFKISYNDTLKNDSIAFINVIDTLQYNRIKSRHTTITIFHHRLIYKLQPKVKGFIGIGVNNFNNRFGILGKFGILTKKEQLYIISYNPFNQYFELSALLKIRFKKK